MAVASSSQSDLRPDHAAGSLSELAEQLRSMAANDNLDDHDAIRLVTDVRDRLFKTEPHQSSVLIADPATSGEVRYDAMLGALAEEVSMRHWHLVPPWASTPERFLKPWWFVSPYPAQRTIAFREAPGPYAARGVFIARRSLERT